jgi:hypothetical protein
VTIHLTKDIFLKENGMDMAAFSKMGANMSGNFIRTYLKEQHSLLQIMDKRIMASGRKTKKKDSVNTNGRMVIVM